MQKVCRRYAVQKTLLLVHIWYSHTLSLFQTNIKPLNPNEYNPKHFVETVFPPLGNFCLAPYIFWDIFISADIPLFPKRRHIYTRTAPNLFLTKTTKLTSHGTSRYPASPLTLYSRLRQLYTRRNQRAFLEDSGSCFFPKPDHIIFVLSHQPLVI